MIIKHLPNIFTLTEYVRKSYQWPATSRGYLKTLIKQGKLVLLDNDLYAKQDYVLKMGGVKNIVV